MKKGRERNKRHSVNAVNALLSFLFAFLAVHLSDGGGQFATKINEIARHLNTAVAGLNVNVTYSDYVDNETYLSNTQFRAGGMAGLYNLTDMFINVIAPDDILMKGLITITNNGNHIQLNKPDIPSVVKYYANLVTILLFLLVCLLFFPLCGLCFCCCRCCGNCGARPQPSDKKKDTAKKIIQGSLLIFCGTGLLFCVVCAFASSQQFQDGLEEFPTNLNNAIVDTTTYMESTKKQINHLLNNNYHEFANVSMDLMNNGSNIAMDHLKNFTNASAVSTISEFVNNLDNINTTLYTMKTNTNKLRVYASQLNDALRKVKRDLTNTLNVCTLSQCKELKTKIDKLQTNIDFNQVPDLSSTIDSLNSLNITGIRNGVESGTNQLKGIEEKINTTLRDGLSQAKQQLANAGATIQDNLFRVTDTVNQVKDQIRSTASPVVNVTQKYISEYGRYRYYIGITISCVLLLVTICIVLGLTCGVCGKRPDGYSDNCCNKGTGSQFLMCAVVIMFLFGFVISAITLVTLFAGVVSEKTICDPLRNPDPKEYTLISLLDQINLHLDIDVVPSNVLNNCHRNMSIYKTFNLKTKFNLDEIKSQYDISDALNKLNLSNIRIDKDLVLINNRTFEHLRQFDPQINVEGFMDELSRNLTNYNLNQLANALENIIASLTNDPDNLKPQLQLSLLHLRTYEEKLIIPMKDVSVQLIESAKELSEQIKMGHSSFADAIDNLLNEVNEAQAALRQNGTAILTETANYFINVTLNLIDDFIDRVTYHVEDKIGQCGPLSRVINGTLTSTCEKVLLPWNGFWFSLFGTIVLYVITIIIAVKLSNLYQKHKPYDHYVEARGGQKRSKKKGKKSKRYDERPSSRRDLAREYTAGSHPSGRYDDMAPKQWEDFPNGGPPQYPRAPTEYERPPPYYYPGSEGDH